MGLPETATTSIQAALDSHAEVALSSVRAAGLGLQKAAMRRTGDSRLLAWAARR